MAISDIEKMIAVGLIWGTTNALMRKGAIIWDQKSSQSSQPSHHHHHHLHQRIILSLQNYLNLILTWQYSIPLFLNLSASATFFAILGHTPISLAVPVTNATTFAATAVMGMLLEISQAVVRIASCISIREFVHHLSTTDISSRGTFKTDLATDRAQLL